MKVLAILALSVIASQAEITDNVDDSSSPKIETIDELIETLSKPSDLITVLGKISSANKEIDNAAVTTEGTATTHEITGLLNRNLTDTKHAIFGGVVYEYIEIPTQDINADTKLFSDAGIVDGVNKIAPPENNTIFGGVVYEKPEEENLPFLEKAIKEFQEEIADCETQVPDETSSHQTVVPADIEEVQEGSSADNIDDTDSSGGIEFGIDEDNNEGTDTEDFEHDVEGEDNAENNTVGGNVDPEIGNPFTEDDKEEIIISAIAIAVDEIRPELNPTDETHTLLIEEVVPGYTGDGGLKEPIGSDYSDSDEDIEAELNITDVKTIRLPTESEIDELREPYKVFEEKIKEKKEPPIEVKPDIPAITDVAISKYVEEAIDKNETAIDHGNKTDAGEKKILHDGITNVSGNSMIYNIGWYIYYYNPVALIVNGIIDFIRWMRS